jgi:hypothetical protein
VGWHFSDECAYLLFQGDRPAIADFGGLETLSGEGLSHVGISDESAEEAHNIPLIEYSNSFISQT